MSNSTSSGDSLTLENLERFIEYGALPQRELIAPNLEIAKLWERQYPGYTILVAPKRLPSKELEQ